MKKSFERLGAGGRVLAAAVIAGAFVSMFAAVAEAKPLKPAKPVNVTVMTRNLYLGADLIPVILAPDPPSARTAAGEIYKTVQDTNIVARAKLLVQEIEAGDPDLIGLQEVALWRRGQRNAADGPTTPATEPVFDYLEIMQDELRRNGLKYEVVSEQNEADIEIPTDITGDGTAEFDGRLTMRDVILVKKGTETNNSQSGNFDESLSVPTQLGQVDVLRGWNSVDVKMAKKGHKPQKFRFVNTHLESFFHGTRTLQATELVGVSGAVDTGKPVILLGDLNSDPADNANEAAAYNRIVGDEYVEDGGFDDFGVEENTCCFSETLFDTPPATFTSRIDHVLGRGDVSDVSATLIGDDPALRTNTGLWPTDHGGVVATLKVG